MLGTHNHSVQNTPSHSSLSSERWPYHLQAGPIDQKEQIPPTTADESQPPQLSSSFAASLVSCCTHITFKPDVGSSANRINGSTSSSVVHANHFLLTPDIRRCIQCVFAFEETTRFDKSIDSSEILFMREQANHSQSCLQYQRPHSSLR